MVWENIQEYNQHFTNQSQRIKAGPVQDRTCTQWGCLIVFVLIFVATFGGGGFFIYQGKSQIMNMITISQINPSGTGLGFIMAKFTAPIVGMMALSIGLSVIVIVIGKSFPQPTMYFLIAFTFLTYIVLIIVGFAMNVLALGITFSVLFLVHGIVLYCLWPYMKVGLKLLACASRFIVEKPAVYFISVMCLVLNAGYIVFWVFSWLGVYSTGEAYNNQTYKILTIVWYVDAIFWGFFLYYCMVFLIASACAYWYYQSESNSVLRGINNIKYHLGSICFGSIVITLITIMRILASGKKSQGPARLIAAFAECILRCMEDYIKILNNNAIIVMSVTAQGYISSAKTAISLIFDNLAVFIIVDYFSSFYDFFSVIFIGVVPAMIGGGIIYNIQSSIESTQTIQSTQAISYAIWGGIIIMLLSIVISSVIIGLLNQALHCIYIFYCFDKKFKDMGINVKNIPPQITQIFGEGEKNEAAHEASIQYLNGNQD